MIGGILKPSPGRGLTGGAGTGVGRDKVGPGAAPLPPPAGGTFPQGKAKSPLLLGEGGRAKP